MRYRWPRTYHAGGDGQLLEGGYDVQERLGLLLGAETHDTLDSRPVVPAAVEDDDLARRGEIRQVTLRIHLRLFPLRGRGQRDDPEHARAHPLGDRLDHAALSRPVSPLEEDAHLETLELHPLLEMDELDVQLGQLLFVGLRFILSFALSRPMPCLSWRRLGDAA